MNYVARTTVPDVSGADLAALRSAVADLYDREALRNLVALYSLARDSNDIDGLVPFFAPDGSFEIGGRVVSGHAALRDFYLANMGKYRTSLHTTHTHVIDVDGARASGLVTGHAELAYAGTLMLAAYQYDDEYIRTEGRWTFAHRRLAFMYAVPADQMATSFGDGLRMRWPGEEPGTADIPERFDTYRAP